MNLVLSASFHRSFYGSERVQRICERQWTGISLSQTQSKSGIIPLRHLARLLTIRHTEGEKQLYLEGKYYPAELHNIKDKQYLFVPPDLTKGRLDIAIKQHGEGFFLNANIAPSYTNNIRLLDQLKSVGWQHDREPFDEKGVYILPYLIKASDSLSSFRKYPTLSLQRLVSLYQSERIS